MSAIETAPSVRTHYAALRLEPIYLALATFALVTLFIFSLVRSRVGSALKGLRDAEKAAQTFAEWARKRSADGSEASRVVAATDPAGVVLSPRPAAGQVAAVVLVAPRGTARRALADAATLLAPWQAVDAVVVPA